MGAKNQECDVNDIFRATKDHRRIGSFKKILLGYKNSKFTKLKTPKFLVSEDYHDQRATKSVWICSVFMQILGHITHQVYSHNARAQTNKPT